MAPEPGIDTKQIREKARKDLLDLLEGVCKVHQNQTFDVSFLKFIRFEAGRILLLKSHLLAVLIYS